MSVIKGFKIGNDIFYYQDLNLAEEFSVNKTYKIGDYAVNSNNGKLYRCISPITIAGAWDNNKWEETTLSQEIDELVIVNDNEPQAPSNKIWIPETQPEGVEVPTNEEFEGLVNQVTNARSSIINRGYIQGSTGYFAHDDEILFTVPYLGGNGFVITIVYDENENRMRTDKTGQEIYDAFQGGRNVVVHNIEPYNEGQAVYYYHTYNNDAMLTIDTKQEGCDLTWGDKDNNHYATDSLENYLYKVE